MIWTFPASLSIPARDAAGNGAARPERDPGYHFDALYRLQSDPEVKRYELTRPSTEADTRRFIRRSLRDRTGRTRWRYEIAVALTDTDQLIGEFGPGADGLGRKDGASRLYGGPRLLGPGLRDGSGGGGGELCVSTSGSETGHRAMPPGKRRFVAGDGELGMRRIKGGTRLRLRQRGMVPVHYVQNNEGLRPVQTWKAAGKTSIIEVAEGRAPSASFLRFILRPPTFIL